MPGCGFHFQYRLSGLPPSVRRFARADAEGLVSGDMASFDAGVARLAATGDVTFLGCVIAPAARAQRHIEVIADEDAVYGVRDPVARRAGTNLDLTGGSGAQTVKKSVNDDFEVVVDSTADEQTSLRITVGRHWEFTVAVPAGETMPSRAPLTRARERELVMAAAAGDRAATAELVEAFLPAIAGVARLYRGTAMIDRTELLQEGVVGLLRAVGRFDPSVGSPFWAYATWWVRQAMQQLVSELSRPTVLSDRAQRGLARIRDTRASYLQAHRREPSLAELVTLVDLPRDTVESLLALEQASLPLGVGLGGDDERASVVGAGLADPVAEDEYERILTRLEIEQLRDLTNTLTERERSIVFEHYGLEGPRRTLREIGAELGISAERVRQIEEQALEKIRAAAVLDRQT